MAGTSWTEAQIRLGRPTRPLLQRNIAQYPTAQYKRLPTSSPCLALQSPPSPIPLSGRTTLGQLYRTVLYDTGLNVRAGDQYTQRTRVVARVCSTFTSVLRDSLDERTGAPGRRNTFRLGSWGLREDTRTCLRTAQNLIQPHYRHREHGTSRDRT